MIASSCGTEASQAGTIKPHIARSAAAQTEHNMPDLPPPFGPEAPWAAAPQLFLLLSQFLHFPLSSNTISDLQFYGEIFQSNSMQS